jgi:hypothetical protein
MLLDTPDKPLVTILMNHICKYQAVDQLISDHDARAGTGHSTGR